MSETPESPAPAVTLHEMVTWLRAPSYETQEPEKTMLAEALASAIEHVESKTGPIVSASRTYEVRPSRDKLVLPDTFLVEVAEVRDPDGRVVEPFDVNLPAGIVELAATPSTRRAWTVVARSRADVSSLKLAVKIIASHLFDTVRRRPGAAGTTYPSGEDGAPDGDGFAIPRRAATLIGPYRRPL